MAEACEVFQRTAGIDAAVDVVRSRSGTHFDPEIAELVSTDPESLFDDLDQDTVDELLAAEPVERGPLTDDELDQALEAIGDFCDLRCPFFAGHARATADLVRGAAELMQMPAADARLAYRAALVHDVGRFGVPGSVWAKARAVDGQRAGAGAPARLLRRADLQPARAAAPHRPAGGHPPRADGRLRLPPRRRRDDAVVAGAGSWRPPTPTAPCCSRVPYREPLSEAEAARELQADVADGRLDPVATDAVLAAAGHRVSRTRAGGPAGLTTRESEVLALLAQGMPNKGIARELGISPKTVSNHIEHVYSKLGVSNRAGAAMYAMQYGIVGSGPVPTG